MHKVNMDGILGWVQRISQRLEEKNWCSFSSFDCTGTGTGSSHAIAAYIEVGIVGNGEGCNGRSVLLHFISSSLCSPAPREHWTAQSQLMLVLNCTQPIFSKHWHWRGLQRQICSSPFDLKLPLLSSSMWTLNTYHTHILNREQIMVVHSTRMKLLPSPISGIVKPLQAGQVDYRIARNSAHDMEQLRVNITAFSHHPKPRHAIAWNQVPESVKSGPLHTFKQDLKEYYFSRYNSECDGWDCQTCHGWIKYLCLFAHTPVLHTCTIVPAEHYSTMLTLTKQPAEVLFSHSPTVYFTSAAYATWYWICSSVEKEFLQLNIAWVLHFSAFANVILKLTREIASLSGPCATYVISSPLPLHYCDCYLTHAVLFYCIVSTVPKISIWSGVHTPKNQDILLQCV